MIEKDWILRAAAAMKDGSTEEKLIRLMCWISALANEHTPHSKIYDPIEILNDGRMWCDQQVKVFLFFADKLLNIQGREIDLQHTDGINRHTVCEVFYDESYHLFDVSAQHRTIYRNEGKILSHADLKRDPAPIEAENHWWRGKNGEGKVGFYR